MLETLLQSILKFSGQVIQFLIQNFSYLRQNCPICCLNCLFFFTVVKPPSTIRFLAAWWRDCPKGLFYRTTSATISTRKNLQCFFLGAFCFNNIQSELFAKRFLPFPSRYFFVIGGPLLTFLIFANADHKKWSSTVGLEEVLFVQST